MKHEKILHTLENLGLGKKEAKVYITLLGLGKATATKLAERAGITRTLIYEITAKLMEKGLVSSIVKEGVKHFSAADPESLLDDLEKKKENITEVMPYLKSIQGTTKEETKVEVFRGRKGINSILKMIIADGKSYYITGGAEEGCGFFEHENKVFVKRAAEARIKGHILVRKGDDFFIGKRERYRYLPPKLISLVSNISWGGKTAIFVWSEPYYAIVINDEKIARSNISTFNYLWESAEEPAKADIRKRTFQ